MDTIAELDPIDEPSPDDGEDSEDEWLKPEDVSEIRSAQDAAATAGRRRKNGWTAALIGSTLFHLALIGAAVTILSRVHCTFHWRIARGDPEAQSGMSIRSQTDETASMDALFISAPRIPMQSVISQSTLEDASAEASVLPDSLLPPPVIPDPVIGLGVLHASPARPNFASKKLPIQVAGAAAVSSASKSPAPAGIATPPRVAGPRGQRDGFDSRGLPIPDYPAESRRRGEEGVVVVDVEVLPDGSVGVIRVVSDAGHPRLAAAAVEKLKTATFEPAQQDGKRVVGHVLIPYRFTLE